MSCLTVNTQVNKQVVNIHNQNQNQNDMEVKHETPPTPPAEVHYPDLASNDKLSDIVLRIVLKQVTDSNKTIELTADELKEVIKTVCNCNEVLIECDDPSVDAVSCCGSSTNEVVYKSNVNKILLKYNERSCLEDFKMHYNELKIVTEDYKININTVINTPSKSKKANHRSHYTK